MSLRGIARSAARPKQFPKEATQSPLKLDIHTYNGF
jgi:hypothetical protein